ncbi:MAG: ComEC/Rec2 family competence protein [Chloroflexi bacterium]|nr:ComEC/Rec2 family competence protein [Chloroflexota bacterium]
MKLVTAAVFFVLGVSIALEYGIVLPDRTTAFAYATLVVTSIFVVSNRTRMSGKFGLAFALLLVTAGFVRGAASADSQRAEWMNVPRDGQSITATAWLDSDAQRAANGVRLTLRATAVDGEVASFPLTVFATGLSDLTSSGRTSDGFRYGDAYEFSGRFAVATGEYSVNAAGTVFTGVVTLVSSEHGNSVRRYVAGIRESLANHLDSAMPEPASGISTAMLVGERTGIPDELNTYFRDSGTSHILAISGLHIALIGGLALSVAAALLGRKRQFYLLAPLAVTWGYAALAGFSPSVTRAAIMFTVLGAARAAGRQNASLPGIGFAAALMVAINPEILRSLSFQLSFAAIAGISLLTPRIFIGLNRLLIHAKVTQPENNRLVSAVISGIAVSVAASIATWPLVAANFGGTPVWGPLATVVMLPAIPILIITGGAAAFVSVISVQVGEILGWPAWLLGEYVSGVARVFRSVPPGVINTESWGTQTAVFAYAAILVAFEWRRMLAAAAYFKLKAASLSQLRFDAVPAFIRTGVPAWSIAVVGLIAVVTWTGAATSFSSGNSDQLTVTFFETDRGDMILIRTPNGNSVLIDGGRDPLGAVRSIDRVLPFWDRSLDLLIATHPDADHIGGLTAVLERYDVDAVAEIPTSHGSTVYAAWRNAVEAYGGSTVIYPGTVIGLDDGVTLEVLSGGRPFPDAAINDASIVTMLRYGSFAMLLTGDITSITERRLLDTGYDLHATVLKVPHHGSDTSSTESFLQAVDPEIAVAQVGLDNHFGHPTESVVSRLTELTGEDRLFVTSKDGTVTVRTDGRAVQVTSSK